ncbi:hypothetical protein BDV10DRAFT_189548 [Aspergillus recurvatus]
MSHLSKLLSHAANESLSSWPTFTFTLNIPFSAQSINSSPNLSTTIAQPKINETNKSTKEDNIACKSKPSNPLREHSGWISLGNNKTDASMCMIQANPAHKEYPEASTTIRLPHPSPSFFSNRFKRGQNYSSGSNSPLRSSSASGSGNNPHRAQREDVDDWVNIRSSTSTPTSVPKNSRRRRTRNPSNSTESRCEPDLEPGSEPEPEGVRQTRLKDEIANRVLDMPLEDIHDEIQHSIWAVVQRQADGI